MRLNSTKYYPGNIYVIGLTQLSCQPSLYYLTSPNFFKPLNMPSSDTDVV